jgi:hypothetical protein
MSTPARAQAHLDVERHDAWHEYLETIRGQPEPRYTELEVWAWAKLQQRLTAIRARERAIKK